MNRRWIAGAPALALAVGLATMAWVGLGYAGNSPLALLMTGLIAACFCAGALELRRFHRDTLSLDAALDGLAGPLPELGGWLQHLPAALRPPVRQRIEGERVALPGPALTPYLVGLLVMLGMLGTFLGMVVTLKGAVMALESTTDLATIRAALAAPVKGLGLAFGTSVAGVAGSAMLGLASALWRRERLLVAQRLDGCIASTLRVFSLAHQREQTLSTLQAQAGALPAVVDQLQALMAQLAQQQQALGDGLLASQDRFHQQAQASYVGLAASVDQSLKQSLTDSARLASTSIQPVVEATMAGISRETERLQGQVSELMQRQMAEVASLVEQRMAGVAEGLQQGLAGVAQSVAHQMGEVASSVQGQSGEVTAVVREQLGGLAQALEQQLGGLTGAVAQQMSEASQALQAQASAVGGVVAQQMSGVADLVTRQVDAAATRVGQSVDGASQAWTGALARQDAQAQALASGLQAALQRFGDGFAQRTDVLLAGVHHSQQQLHTDLVASDAQRLSAWTGQLAAIATALEHAWQQAGAQAAAQQARWHEVLTQTAHDIGAQAGAQSRQTMAEVAALMQTAAETPRAAAEVMGQLREALSDSLARDNARLDERNALMATLATLLGALNGAATEQRSAIDALVASSTALLAQAGAQFSGTLQAESDKLDAVAAQLGGSAAEVASLGEAFGAGVQSFGQANEALIGQLQRIEAALGKSTARSDEQLAYYVAQAREVVDLTLLSQKQIVEDLQRLSATPPATAGEVV